VIRSVMAWKSARLMPVRLGWDKMSQAFIPARGGAVVQPVLQLLRMPEQQGGLRDGDPLLVEQLAGLGDGLPIEVGLIPSGWARTFCEQTCRR
jgi:hypothetical protein